MAKLIKPVDSQDVLLPPTSVPNSLFLNHPTADEISCVIDSLKNKKAVRENDVDTKLIKLSKDVLSPILSELFNLSIATGSYPDCLKIAEVIPIYQKSDPCKCNNYRPISLLSQFDKIFEKLLGNRLISFLEKYNLLSKQQFGFRQNSTTTYAIANIHD